MTHRVHNFGGGPAALPLSVLKKAQSELLDFEGSGMSIMEVSHRSSLYDRVHNEAIKDLRTLLKCPEDQFSIFFMGGGARTHFALSAMNLLQNGEYAEYLTTGKWSEVALAEAQRTSDVREIWSSAESDHKRVPRTNEYQVSAGSQYLHFTNNNTIFGTQFPEPPQVSCPLVCDMTSELLSRSLDLSRYGLIYASAQKNLGPAGVTILIMRNDFLEKCSDDLPGAFSYKQVVAKNSLLNTPPCFAIYLVGLVAKELLARGGVETAQRESEEKADLIYGTIDNSGGYYRGCAEIDSRSKMNVTFRLPSEDLEKQFISEAAEHDIVAIKGYRTVGGIRASIYNAVTLESVQVLTKFMNDFQQRTG
jgi:phosphoserine aminotransferase